MLSYSNLARNARKGKACGKTGWKSSLRGMSETPRKIQLHLVLAYKHEVREHPRIKAHLARGYRIVQLQRVTDREVLVTLNRSD